MAGSQSLLSVGIDIGTTTTQVIFSRLTLAEVARPGQAPRAAITQREILHRSPIVLTPLSDPTTIDVERLFAFIQDAYAAAGITPQEVDTGAVIITGESAKKRNADALLAALAGLAGEFVVSVAGPHLESLIAGRGSGAAHFAQTQFAAVTNIDIGGGTANCITFHGEGVVASAAMNVGGRLVEIDPVDGRVCAVSEPARAILVDCGIRLSVGQPAALGELQRFTDRMADLVVELIEGRTSPLASQLYLTPPMPSCVHESVLMFSGGVGFYYNSPVSIERVAEAAIHRDVGPLLADSLRRHPALKRYRIVAPAETVRATVIGAGMRTVALSGATIWIDPKTLPIRNIPVVRVFIPTPPTRDAVTDAVHRGLVRHDIDPDTDAFAIALEGVRRLDYNALVELASGLMGFAGAMPPTQSLVVVVEHDYALVLGQTIKAMAPQRPLLVIDQVNLAEGDYIDVGLPILDGRVVPLSIKTLVFYR